MLQGSPPITGPGWVQGGESESKPPSVQQGALAELSLGSGGGRAGVGIAFLLWQIQLLSCFQNSIGKIIFQALP